MHANHVSAVIVYSEMYIVTVIVHNKMCSFELNQSSLRAEMVEQFSKKIPLIGVGLVNTQYK